MSVIMNRSPFEKSFSSLRESIIETISQIINLNNSAIEYIGNVFFCLLNSTESQL